MMEGETTRPGYDLPSSNLRILFYTLISVKKPYVVMEDVMFEDCCVECGHLLSQQRDVCPFCGWHLQGDQYADKLESDYRFGNLVIEDIGPDRLSADDISQRIVL